MTLDHILARNPLSKGQVLLVATSADKLATGTPTGAWLGEVAVPYVTFVEAGYDVTIASPKGGAIPIDANSLPAKDDQGLEAQTIQKFQTNETAQQMMHHSVPLDKVEKLHPYSALFMAGGHGASVDFPTCAPLQKLIKEALTENSGVVVAGLCHGNAAFATEEIGKLIAGKKVSAFSDAEEEAVGKTSEVPFLLERRLKELGADVVNGAPWGEQVSVDGNLVTGQNPASALKTAQEVISAMASNAPAGSGAAAAGGTISPRVSHPGTMTAAEVPVVLGVAPLLHPPTSTTENDIRSAVEQAGGIVEPSTADNLGQAAFPNPGTNANNEAGASG